MSESSPFESNGGTADLKRARRRQPAGDNPRVDRLPPHSPEAEQGLLGCCLLSPHETIDGCIEIIGERPEPFYDLRHQTIWQHLVAMFDERVPIDVITLQQRLKDAGLLEQIGGIPYLSTLQDAVPSASNFSYYAQIVSEKWFLRRMIHGCTSIVERVYEHQGEVDVLKDEAERDMLAMIGTHTTNGFQPIRNFVGGTITEIEGYHQNQGAIMGLQTGFPDLDRMTGGFNGGEMIVIAARPSMGKTSLAMNIAENVAVNNRLPVGVFSLEMTSQALTTRMIASNARVNLRNIRDGFMSEADFPRLTAAAGRVNAAPLFIDDTPGLSVMQIRSKARKLMRTENIRLFVIDYLQLAKSMTKRGQENRQQEVSEISSGIKALAKELNVPIIVLSQLNRELEKDKKRKPRLSDIRESGSIEQDADLVGFLYKAHVNEDEDAPAPDEQEGVPVNLLIAKQRNGPTGDVNLTFLKSLTRFENAARVSDEDIPAARDYRQQHSNE